MRDDGSLHFNYSPNPHPTKLTLPYTVSRVYRHFLPFYTLAKFRFPHFRKLVGDDCFSLIVYTFYMQHLGSNLTSLALLYHRLVFTFSK